MAEFFKMFGVEFKPMLVQVLGFVVLVWALAKYFFQPVGKILEERQKTISSTLAQVQEQQEEWEGKKRELETKLQHIEEEGQNRIAEMLKEGESLKERLIQEAKSEAEKILKKGQDQLKREEEATLARVRDELAGLVLLATKQVLQDLVDEKVQQKSVEKTLQKLQAAAWKS